MKNKQKNNNNKQGSFLPNFLIRPTTNVRETTAKHCRDNVSFDPQGGDPSAMHNIWPQLFKRWIALSNE